MGIMNGNLSLEGRWGRVWPNPKKSKRKRFVALFEDIYNPKVRYFPTRKSAHEWLVLRALMENLK